MEQIRSAEGIAAVRAVIQAAKCTRPQEEVTDEEIKRSEAVVRKIMAETERLGLYK